MSDRRRALLILLAVVVGLTVGGGRAGAQDPLRTDADSLRALLLDARRETIEATAIYDARRGEIGRSRDRLIVAGGRTVRFAAAEVTDGDTAAVARGLVRGRAELVRRFGEASAAALIDTSAWILRGSPDQRGIGSQVTLTTSELTGAQFSHLRRPIDPLGVERLVLRVAGDRVAGRTPWLLEFGGASLSLADHPTRWADAARELAISWAATGRRCATGVIASCEIVMTRRERGAPTPAWLDVGDARAAIVASEVPRDADAALVEERSACLRGDDAACDRVLPRIVIRDPFSANVRASLAVHAIELGGIEALDRIRSAPAGTPVSRLAYVAGVEPDALLRSWQARLAAALRDDRDATVPITLSSLAWCLLLGGLVTRRRP